MVDSTDLDPSRFTAGIRILKPFCAKIVPNHGNLQLKTRSCARGVSAQNAFRLAAPASNMVMIYGMGGIGMSTMASNGLLMQVVMQQYF